MTLRVGPSGETVPLFSRIASCLWMGGYTTERTDPIFGYVLNLYQTGRPHYGKDVVHRTARLDDSDEIPGGLGELAEWVNRYRQYGHVLVRCRTGLNRSGLVVGLALVRSGMTPDEAITLMREKRSPAVLRNAAFEKWLREQGAPE